MGWFGSAREERKPRRPPPRTPEPARDAPEPASLNAWYDNLNQQSHLDSTYGEYESCSDERSFVSPSPRGFFDRTAHTPEATPRRRAGAETYWARRAKLVEDPPAGETLGAARARRAFEAVEPAELGLEVDQQVLVLREELGPTPGWVFAVCGDASGYVPRTYLQYIDAPRPADREPPARDRDVDATHPSARRGHEDRDVARAPPTPYVSKKVRNSAAYNAPSAGAPDPQGEYWRRKLGGDEPPAHAPRVPLGPVDPVAPGQVERMTAPKLKIALAQRGLSTAGLKGDLKARLLAALRPQVHVAAPVTVEAPDLLEALLAPAAVEPRRDHLAAVARPPAAARRPSADANGTYATVLEMCLAGDAGEPEDARAFAADFRARLSISDAAHGILLARLKPSAVWKAALHVEPTAAQASGRSGRQGDWLAERRRRSFELDSAKACLWSAAAAGHLGQIRAALAEAERLGLCGFVTFECVEAEACLAARAAAEARDRLDELSQAHKDKFTFDYGPRDSLRAVMFQARANALKVAAYDEAPPPAPAPAPLGDGWSSEEEELVSAPPLVFDAESIQEALKRERRAYVRRARTDAEFLAELDDRVRDRLDVVGEERGHAVEAAASFADRALAVLRAPRVRFVQNGVALRLEALSVLRDDVSPALRAADAECLHRNLALRATINVYVRAAPGLSRRKRAQADALARWRAEVIVELLVAHGVRRGCLEAATGGADEFAGVDVDLGFYDEEPPRSDALVVLSDNSESEDSSVVYEFRRFLHQKESSSKYFACEAFTNFLFFDTVANVFPPSSSKAPIVCIPSPTTTSLAPTATVSAPSEARGTPISPNPTKVSPAPTTSIPPPTFITILPPFSKPCPNSCSTLPTLLTVCPVLRVTVFNFLLTLLW